MSETMRAAVYDRAGDAHDVLRVTEIERPEPGPGEVRVRVRVSGVNPTDWKSRAGARGAAIAYDYVVPNQDGAGEIDAVGEGVDASRVGERVWVWFGQYQRQRGTAAEWIAVPARQAVPLPDGVSFEFGASLGIPAMTAHRCLFADGPIAGQTVLVAGGAGAVGHFAIELAKHAGARVIATVSSDLKAELAEKAGADVVIDYHEGDTRAAILEAAPGGVDRIVEVAPAENFALDVGVLAPAATIVFYATDDPELAMRVFPRMQANVTLRFVLVYTLPDDALDAAVEGVTAALRAGALSALPEHEFALDEIAAAHQAVEEGAVGKVLVRP